MLAMVAAVELAAFALAATVVDVLLLVLVLVALSAVGGLFLTRQTSGLVRRSFEDVVGASPSAPRQIGDRGLRFLGGVLLLFPGLVTGVIGGLLLLSPVRSAVRPVIGARFGALVPAELSAALADITRNPRRRSPFAAGDIVDVDATIKDRGGTAPSPAAPPELR